MHTLFFLLESCIDKNGEPFCKAAEKSGLCNSNQRAILNGCKKTCGLCRKLKSFQG